MHQTLGRTSTPDYRKQWLNINLVYIKENMYHRHSPFSICTKKVTDIMLVRDKETYINITEIQKKIFCEGATFITFQGTKYHRTMI